MTFKISPFAWESSTTTGTAAFALGGAVTVDAIDGTPMAMRAFSEFLGDGDTTWYVVRNRSVPAEWEEGVGTWGTGATLTRTMVLRSSNADAAVNFSAGIKDVICAVPTGALGEGGRAALAATDAAGLRTAAGLGTLATQDADNVVLTGDLTIDGDYKLVYDPAAAFEFLRVNNPAAFTGARYFKMEMQHAANPDGNGFDDVVRWGFNLDGSQINSLPGLWYAMEPDYRPGSTDRWVESHMSVFHPNGSAELRASSFTFQYQTSQTQSQTVSTWALRANNGVHVSKLVAGATPYLYLTPTQVVWSSQDSTSGIKIAGTTLGTPTALNPSTTNLSPSVDASTFRNLTLSGWAQIAVPNTVKSVFGATAAFDPFHSPFQVAVDAAFNDDIYLVGTAKRIRGDFSNATPSNRTLFQSHVTNGNTEVGLIPNGLAAVSSFTVFGNAGADNSAQLQLIAFSDPSFGHRLQSAVTGTGTLRAINFFMGSTGAARISTDGRVTIGGLTNDGVNALQVTGGMTVSSGNAYKVNNVQVLSSRKTGWTAASGTAARTTFATTTVTTEQLAERVKALIDDLISHGVIGA